jgi:outer membrane lipopolysaccharide assembly protein LptE/RlpB
MLHHHSRITASDASAQLYITRKYVAAFFAAVLARDAEAAALIEAMRRDPAFVSVMTGGAAV